MQDFCDRNAKPYDERKITMIYERSCGAVVFTRINGEVRYLIIKSLTGIYGFPKGHMENGESEEQTAHREVLEETGYLVEPIEEFLVLNKGFTESKYNTDILLPSVVKTDNAEGYKEIIEKVLETKDLSKLLEYQSMVMG